MAVEVIKNDYMIVRANDSIDLTNAEEFDAALKSAITGSSKSLIIDLSDAQYIDSAGIQSILTAYQRVHAKSSKMALIVANRNMRDLIGIVNMDMLPGFYIREDIGSAEQALADNS